MARQDRPLWSTKFVVLSCFVLACAVCGGPTAVRLLAMKQIERAGGSVLFRDRSGAVPASSGLRPRLQANVESIYLTNARPSAATLWMLPALREAEFLSFNSSPLSDGELDSLAVLPQLRTLQLNGTNISAAGLRRLVRFPQLELLTLNDTGLGDESVEALASISSLKRLYLNHTTFTEEALRRLQESLPSCEIQHSPRGSRSGTAADLP